MTEPNENLVMITGAANGLGMAASARIAAHGFDLVLIDIKHADLQRARRQILFQSPNIQIETITLDLSDWAAVAEFARSFCARELAVHALINNAGIFPSFVRQHNAQDCELGMAISFYGHYVLTANLLPSLLRADSPRVATASSIAHSAGHVAPDDPGLKHNYDAARAYSDCKIASLIFARQLAEQAHIHSSKLISVATHPGIARTTIGQQGKNPAHGLRQHAMQWATRFAMGFLGQDADQGAAAMVYAATQPKLDNGSFIGPAGWLQFKGPAKVVQPKKRALQRHDEAAIWGLAANMTGQKFDWTGAAP